MKPRIVTIGHDTTSLGDISKWDTYKLPNVVDYDAVVIDLSTIPDEPTTLMHDEVAAFHDRLTRLVGIGRDVLVFLPTQFTKVPMKSSFSDPRKPGRYRLNFIPWQVSPVLEGGVTKELVDNSYKWFVDKIQRWNFHFNVAGHATRDNAPLHGTGAPIAVNQEKRWLAATLKFPKEGTVVFLPTLPYLSNTEIAAKFLAMKFPDYYGATEPPWAAGVSVFGMSALAQQIATVTTSITELESQRASLRLQHEALREYRRLVFESGTPLERIVRRTFVDLGGTISTAKYGDEEFVLVWNGREALVEVKGLGKSAQKTNISQLLNHLVSVEDDTERKGILVANTWRELPLSDRESASNASFPANVVSFAEKNDIALVTGAELLKALTQTLSGALERGKAIDHIMSTAGVVTF